MTDKTLNYEPLHEFAARNRVSYNELCVAVRAALAAQPAEPVAQPYAWHYTNNGGASVWHMGPSNRIDADIAASAEFPKVHKVTPVYAAQSDPAAVPLTKEQRELFDLILHHYGPDKRLQPLRDLIAAAGNKT